MAKKEIEALLKKLPHSPGVYKMKDSEDKVLYVGKAINLSNRVRSYFRNLKNQAVRTRKLVENTDTVEWTEVASDWEALMLETNWIKEFKPKYNVLMKDDKNFVYVKITKDEDYPRIEIVRKVEKDKARYFGPKTAAHQVKKTLTLLQKLFMYRSCDLGIEWQAGESGEEDKVKITNKTLAYPCLDYHIKRCAAPCIAKISPEDYAKSIAQIELFLEGKSGEIEAKLKAEMSLHVQNKEFEKAALSRDKLLSIEQMSQKQVVTTPDHDSLDVFGFVLDQDKAYVILFIVRNGKVVDEERFVLDAPGFERGEEDLAHEVLESFLFQYYDRAVQFPEELLVPIPIVEEDLLIHWLSQRRGKNVYFRTPQKGKKHQLLDLAQKNAESFRKQHLAKWQIAGEAELDILKNLAEILGLKKPPQRIECFDISHLGGTDTVASMVVFEGGKAKNFDYRRFRMKSIQDGEIDDYKSMAEVLRRRLIRLEPYKTLARQENTILKKHGKLKRLYAIVSFEEREKYELLGFQGIKIIPKNLRKEIQAYVKKKKLKKYELFSYEGYKDQDSSFQTSPDLILIDGGKGQLNAALKVAQELKIKIPMIGLAKREEDVFLPEKSLPLLIPKDSQALYLLRRIRDEAHRFAIDYQKNTRKKHLTQSELDVIPGIGAATKMKLLRHFGSVEKIKEASLEELVDLTGRSVATKIAAHFNQI